MGHSLADRRPIRKRQAIIDTLRGEVVSGALTLGGRMPSQFEIARRFGTSRVTAQWALQQLCHEGFIRTRARSGTFVADNPPHRNNYALAFWNNPEHPPEWSKFYDAILNAARQVEREDGRRFELFYNIDQHVDTEDYQRLYRLIMTQRLAGVIFVNLRFAMEESPLVTETSVPRVLLTTEPPPGALGIALDVDLWMRKALDYFRARGRKRLAVLTNGWDGNGRQLFSQWVAERGLTCPPRWQHFVNTQSLLEANHCVQLLMDNRPETRPDALLIMDDNFLEDASAGLIASGVRVGEDIDVVAHANFPLTARAVVPIRRLGFDIRSLVRTAVDLIDRRRRGEELPRVGAVPALFEDELAAGQSPAVVLRGGKSISKRRMS